MAGASTIGKLQIEHTRKRTTAELAHALVDLEHQHWLETITPEIAAAMLEAQVSHLSGLVQLYLEQWPTFAAKLSTDQREVYVNQIRIQITRLVRALRGEG